MTDLTPINPAGKPLQYNFAGHLFLCGILDQEGLGCLYIQGPHISKEDCTRIADAIEKQLPSMTDYHRKWIGPHVDAWRNSGGFSVW